MSKRDSMIGKSDWDKFTRTIGAASVLVLEVTTHCKKKHRIGTTVGEYGWPLQADVFGLLEGESDWMAHHLENCSECKK